MAHVHHHAPEVWPQAQAQGQDPDPALQVKGRIAALEPPGQLLVVRFAFSLFAFSKMNDCLLRVARAHLTALLSAHHVLLLVSQVEAASF